MDIRQRKGYSLCQCNAQKAFNDIPLPTGKSSRLEPGVQSPLNFKFTFLPALLTTVPPSVFAPCAQRRTVPTRPSEPFPEHTIHLRNQCLLQELLPLPRMSFSSLGNHSHSCSKLFRSQRLLWRFSVPQSQSILLLLRSRNTWSSPGSRWNITGGVWGEGRCPNHVRIPWPGSLSCRW